MKPKGLTQHVTAAMMRSVAPYNVHSAICMVTAHEMAATMMTAKATDDMFTAV